MGEYSLFEQFQTKFKEAVMEEMSLQEYLELCRSDPSVYASAAERMCRAVGKPQIIDTKHDERLSKIFSNRQIKLYASFGDFYGTEDTIEKIVSFYKHAEQGLEEKKQILYLLGPVGGGKSSIAENLKRLMEGKPIYVIAKSPAYESPLGLFPPHEWGEILEKEYKIPRHRLIGIASPWAMKRLQEFEGDITKFRVAKLRPSELYQIGIDATTPGDENTQDVSALVGKPDMNKLEKYSLHDADAYDYAGTLNRTTQGLFEFVEMFKAPLKVLHPLLTATQERRYKGTEGVGTFPFEGLILAHSNESEWLKFKEDRNNQAFLDRIYIVKVPYCLRVSEEIKIYEKLLRESALSQAPCAPGTLKMLAQFAVLSRLKKPEQSTIESKLRVYDGESLKDVDPKAKTIQEYRDWAGVDEGMTGMSTRFSFKVLSKVFNYDFGEVAANPVHLLYVLEQEILQKQLPKEVEDEYKEFLKKLLSPNYAEFIGKEIQKAYLESYSEYGQNIFDRYITYADYWIQDDTYRDPDTNESFDRSQLNEELEKIEKPAGIANPKDFRNEVVRFALRARSQNQGKNPQWTSYEKLREVVEKKMFSKTEDLLPVISFGAKASTEHQEKHNEFVTRMTEKGYTERQVRLLCEWYLRVKKSS